jgi:hypothetical protein
VANGVDAEPVPSTVKVETYLRGEDEAPPASEEVARGRQMLRAAMPLVRRFIPTDPRELDHLLLAYACKLLSLRSDDAEPVARVVLPDFPDVDPVAELAAIEAGEEVGEEVGE